MAINASTITIVELEGPQRSLTLTGAGLPSRGATWGGETRLKTKFPAGNPEAVQHVIGPAEAPTELEGTWRTNLLTRTPATYVDESGSGQALTLASSLVDAMETIARGGALLEVTWSTDDGRSILRQGRIGPYSSAFDRFDDVKWKVKFVWIGRGSTPSSVELAGDQAAAAKTVSSALQALDDVALEVAQDAAQSWDPDNWGSASTLTLGDFEGFSATFTLDGLVSTSIDSAFSVGFGFGASVGFSATGDVGFGVGISSSNPTGAGAGFLSGLVASVTATFADVQAALAAARAAKLTPLEQAREAAASARRIVRELGGAQNLVGQVPPELLSSTQQPGAILRATRTAAQAAGQIDKAMSIALSLRSTTRQVLSGAKVGHDQVDRAGAGDQAKTIISKAGETFASLAQRFYGSPDNAATIAKANGFAGYRIAPGGGVRLLIPRISTTNAATRS